VGNKGVKLTSEDWRPIRLIQVNLDTLSDATSIPSTAGERIWVEIVRRRQVIGVAEVLAEGDSLSPEVLRELVSDFSEVPTSSFEPVPDEHLPKATVVVPTICRDPDQLMRTVDSLLQLDYPDVEIIVVDNRSDTKSVPLPTFAQGHRVRVAVELRKGASQARNLGIALATGEFIAFTDDDVEVDKGWLRAMGERFATDAEVDGICGLVLPQELLTAPQLWFEEFYGGFNQTFLAEVMSMRRTSKSDDLFPYAPGRFGAGCNMAFRRSVLVRIGGFDVFLGAGTPAHGGEDPAIFIKLILTGGSLAFEPTALVRHTHRRTERQFMDQVFGYGTGLTAMYTALILRDPRHLWRMIQRMPAGYRFLTRPRSQRSPSATTSYPRRTFVYQIVGMAYGPFAYIRSVISTRWSGRTHRT